MWWSSSTFVTTAISGSGEHERSDSSPSTTSQPSPRPRCRRAADVAADQERRVETEPLEANAIIAAVVVLPCAPATTIDGRSATSSARSSARGCGPDVLRAGIRGRDDHLPAVGRRRALRRSSTPDARRPEPAEVGRLDPVRACDLGPQAPGDDGVGAHAGAADPDEPELPTPGPVRPASAISSSATTSAASGRASSASRRPARRAARIGEQLPDLAPRSSSASGTTTAPPPRSK